MQNLIRSTFLALVSLSVGCVLQERPLTRYTAPAPPQPGSVVIASPQAAPPTPAVIVPAPAAPRKEPWVSVAITSQEHHAIRQHLNSQNNDEREQPEGRKGRGRHLPPGLAKKAARGESLPPGWQKRLVRGETLPTEIYQHCEPVPAQVVAHLPPPPPGTILVTVEGKIVRLLQASLEILDVLDIHVATARP